MDRLPRNRYLCFFGLTAFTLTLDLWSKSYVFEKLGLFGRTEWLIDSWVRFELHTNLNEGALWGMGQGFAPAFAGLSVIAFSAILYVLFIRKAAQSLWLTAALGLVSGGTLGNLYDRLGLHGVCLLGGSPASRCMAASSTSAPHSSSCLAMNAAARLRPPRKPSQQKARHPATSNPS